MKNLYHSDLSKTNYDAIVIGSGIGGLTTAVFLAKSGKKVLVLEKHYEPGGLTHTFKRKNFVWDVGVHYVGQVHKKDALLRKLFDYVTNDQLQWAEMGAVYDKSNIDGDQYNYFSGTDEQIASLITYFPNEEAAIRNYFKLIKKASSQSVKFFSEKSMPRWLSFLIGGLLKMGFYKYSNITTYDALRKITANEKLISVLCAQYGNYGLPPKKSSFAIHAMIVDHFSDGGNYPVGGASSIHLSLTNALESAGGVLAVKAAVSKIKIDNNKAIGVELDNGDVIYGKKIISNAGVSNTFNKLVPPNTKIAQHLNELNKIKPSVSHVCLYVGLSKSDIELNLPKNNLWVYDKYDMDNQFDYHLLEQPFKSPLTYISFPSAKDPEWEMNHKGTATIQVVGSLPFEFVGKWQNEQWQKRSNEYEQIKEQIKEHFLSKLIQFFPQVKEHIAYLELSTPLSTKHFTSYSHGEIYGLEHTPERFKLKFLRPQTDIKNLYLTGQDVVSVGVGAAIFSGLLTAVAVLNRNLLWRVMRK